jgi:hypothetical protein
VRASSSVKHAGVLGSGRRPETLMTADTHIRRMNPPTLSAPTGYTHVVDVVARDARTVYVAGQVAFNERREVVGVGDMAAQTRTGLQEPGGGARCRRRRRSRPRTSSIWVARSSTRLIPRNRCSDVRRQGTWSNASHAVLVGRVFRPANETGHGDTEARRIHFLRAFVVYARPSPITEHRGAEAPRAFPRT